MPDESNEKDQSGISRRNVFGASLASLGVAAAAGSLWTRQANAAPPPDEKIEAIPTFKYDLEKQTHWGRAGWFGERKPRLPSSPSRRASRGFPCAWNRAPYASCIGIRWLPNGHTCWKAGAAPL